MRSKVVTELVAAGVGVVCIALICVNAWKVMTSPEENNTDSSIASTQDEIWQESVVLDSNKDIAVSLKAAVLGESQQMKNLEVFVQKISDVTKVTDQGNLPFNWSAKYQYVKYSGTATYTVDLSNLDDAHLKVNEAQKTLTIIVPHVVQNLDINEDETESDDTERQGIFAIGDLKLTEEERMEVISNVKEMMEQKLEEENAAENADRMAKMSVWEIYQPVVSKVAPEYTVVVEFEGE